MQPEDVAALFTRSDGSYQFARWGRPIVPVVFGVDDATLRVVKGAIEAVVTLARHKMAETDPELGANLMLFFLRDWQELPQINGLEVMVPGLAEVCQRLTDTGANQYRVFRFDPDGAIKAVFAFVRMDAALSEMAAEDLALDQAAGMMCTWAKGAFARMPALARFEDQVILRPEIAGVIRAAYDPVMPRAAQDPSHALRLAARLSRDLASS